MLLVLDLNWTEGEPASLLEIIMVKVYKEEQVNANSSTEEAAIIAGRPRARHNLLLLDVSNINIGI